MPFMAVTEPDWTGNTSNLADDPYYCLWILKRVVLARQQWLEFPANDGTKDPAKQISLDHKHSMAEMVAYCVKLYEYKLAATLAPDNYSRVYTDLARYVPPGYPYQTVMGWQKRLACHLLWQDGGIWVRDWDIPVIECEQRVSVGWGDTIEDALYEAKQYRKTAAWVAVDPPTVWKYRMCAYIELPTGGPKRFYAYLVEELPTVAPVQEYPNCPLAYTIELPATAEPLGEFDPPAHIRQFKRNTLGGSVDRLTEPGEYYWGRVNRGDTSLFPDDCPFEFTPGEEVRCAWGWEAHLANVFMAYALDVPSWDAAFRQAHDIPFYSAPPEPPDPVTPPVPSPTLPSRPVPRPGDRPNLTPGWRKDYNIDGLGAPL